MNTMYPAMVNSPETVLVGAIAADTTTVTVQDVTKLPNPPNLLVLGGERPDAETVLMTAVNENMITIQRGVQGTARAWSDTTTIARNFTAYDYDTLRTNLLELNTTKASRPDQFTSGNFAVLDANGNPSDSGKNPNDYAPAMLTETVAGQGQELQTLSAQAQRQAVELEGKTDKVTDATVGHVVTLDADGNLADGGKTMDEIEPIPATGTMHIYLTKSGNDDTGDGTEENPYLTFDKVLEVIKKLPPSHQTVMVRVGDGIYGDGSIQAVYSLTSSVSILTTSQTASAATLNYKLGAICDWLQLSNITVKSISANRKARVDVYRCDFTTTQNAVSTSDGAFVSLEDCTFHNCSTCVVASDGAIVHAEDLSGTGNQYAYSAHGGIILRTGTTPEAATLDQKIRGGQIFT